MASLDLVGCNKGLRCRVEAKHLRGCGETEQALRPTQRVSQLQHAFVLPDPEQSRISLRHRHESAVLSDTNLLPQQLRTARVLATAEVRAHDRQRGSLVAIHPHGRCAMQGIEKPVIARGRHQNRRDGERRVRSESRHGSARQIAEPRDSIALAVLKSSLPHRVRTEPSLDCKLALSINRAVVLTWRVGNLVALRCRCPELSERHHSHSELFRSGQEERHVFPRRQRPAEDSRRFHGPEMRIRGRRC
eukprot:3340698-Rhodomonas_salina.1